MSVAAKRRFRQRAFIDGLEIELTRLATSPLPLFAKEGAALPLESGRPGGMSRRTC
jgi:hypothetical protein